MTECGDFVDRMWRFCGQNVEILWTECGDFENVEILDQTDKSTIWSVVMTNTDVFCGKVQYIKIWTQTFLQLLENQMLNKANVNKLLICLDDYCPFNYVIINATMTHQLNSWDDVYITLELAPERCAVEFRQSFKVLLISGLHSCV
ncbi:hypothetical protein ACF0H5_010277 [Mactra antiquata]